MADILHHPLLGRVRGKVQEAVIQFLGIKYATLKDRFAIPQLATSHVQGQVLDATKHGPMVISDPNACDFEQMLIQHMLPHEQFEVSGIDGLNLNIAVPCEKDGSIHAETKLPVFVYIHGGGFGIGGNCWPQYDLARLVRLSAEKGSPIIGVTMNYRLGAPGFLISFEMRAMGYKANNGLRDQRTALEWVNKNIGGFGGDPDRITVIGQSAGGASATLHLYSYQPLFKQLMVIGGTHLLFTPFPPLVQDQIYEAVLATLSVGDTDAKKRIESLNTLPVKDLYTKCGFNLPLLPGFDDDLIPASIATFENISRRDETFGDLIPGRKWCGNLLAGDASYDGIVMHAMLGHKKAGAAKLFCRAIHKSLENHPGEAEALLEAYGINPELPDEAAFHAITLFATDIQFHSATLEFTRGWPKEAFVFHFNEPNPWEGPSKGVAAHVLDVAFLFQNFNEFLPVEQRKIAETFASHTIDFICGKAPFPPYDPTSGGAMVYGPPAKGAEFIKSSEPKCLGRSDKLLRIAGRIGYETILQAWLSFMSGT